ncbi:hypothetical protein BDZ89DRAFT_990636 [Hymenopellis radicata]|nr:hypothetical protein BDZ89DRAFT_990636 [Hymenopellis radicata]
MQEVFNRAPSYEVTLGALWSLVSPCHVSLEESGGWFATPVQLEPFDAKTYLTLLLPAQLVYLLCAILVTIPGTYFLRLTLLPFCLLCSYRAATRLGLPYPAGEGLMSMVGWTSMRMIGWALERHHFVRVKKYGASGPMKSRSISDALYDGAELCCNFRGIGWNFSVYPRPLTPQSRPAFLWSCAKSWLFYSLWFEACILAYDVCFSSSSPLREYPYLQRVAETLIFPISTWSHIEGFYVFYGLIGVFACGQDPALWPQLFDAPWRATSLTEFWGKRWHQAFRDMFARAGGRPASGLFGRVGSVLACFLLSGIFHDGVIWGLMGRTRVCCSLTPYFLINGVGVLLEAVWRNTTGNRIGGVLGWIWMMGWLVTWMAATFSGACMDEWYRPFSENMLMRPTYIVSRTLKALAESLPEFASI